MLTLLATRHTAPTPVIKVPGLCPASSSAVILGAHGHAGTTTLAAILPAQDLGLARDYDRGPAPEIRLLVVTRSTAWAAPMATMAVKALTDAGHHIDALAIINDGHPESPEATARFTALESVVGSVIRIPHVPVLRRGSVPAAVSARLPRRARRAFANLRSATHRYSG